MGWLALIASLPLSRKGTELLAQGTKTDLHPRRISCLLGRPSSLPSTRAAHGAHTAAFAHLLFFATSQPPPRPSLASDPLPCALGCSRVVVPARGTLALSSATPAATTTSQRLQLSAWVRLATLSEFAQSFADSCAWQRPRQTCVRPRLGPQTKLAVKRATSWRRCGLQSPPAFAATFETMALATPSLAALPSILSVCAKLRGLGRVHPVQNCALKISAENRDLSSKYR